MHHQSLGLNNLVSKTDSNGIDLGYIKRSFAPSLLYVSLFDAFAPRNNRRSRRIASNKNRITSAIAAAGAARARKDMRSAPPSSAVAITVWPRPPVKMVE